MICRPFRLPHYPLCRVLNFFLKMRFPWKKVAISRFLNDHLRKSQKRRDGSSLVVETGFPTSLVDLFIKNREKLKKARRRSPRSFPSPPPAPASSPVVYPSSLSPVHCGVVNEVSIAGSVDVNSCLLVGLKVFLVVCCVFGSKRLTIGITVSAFLLVFLELLVGFLKPYLVESEVQKDLGSCPSPTRIHNQEIQIDESEIIFQQVDPVIENNCEVVELTRTKSRREKIKSKIDKCLLKKFRSSRKENDPQGNKQPEVCRNIEKSFSGLLEADAEYKEITTQPMRRYMVLLLVVLIGLTGGRAFALVLTLSSYCLLKFL